jgi:hypothetical protein
MMTESRFDPEDEAFNEIERQSQQRKETVKANIKLKLKTQEEMDHDFDVLMRNKTIEEVAQHIEKLKGFGQDTVSSLAIYIREMKK